MSSARCSPWVMRSTNQNTNVSQPPKVDSEASDEDEIDIVTEEDKSYEKLKRSPYLVQGNHASHRKCGTVGAHLAGHHSPLASESHLAPTGTPQPPLASPTHSRRPSTTNGSGTIFGIVAILCVLASLFSSFLYLCASPPPEIQLQTERQIQFERAFDDRLSHLKTAFQSQSGKTWRTIRAAVIATAALQPKTPGVIAAIGTERAQLTVACLTLTLADAIRHSYNDSGYIRVNGAHFQRRTHDSSDVKLELDGIIRSGLSLSNMPNHVGLVERLDLLPAKSGLLFHGFCDNENAPFKRAVYIFTSQVDDAATGDLVDLQVTGAWEGVLDEDQRSSIESRIGNHIVNIVSESANTLASTCR